MPFTVQKQDFEKMFNGVYKKVVMEDLHVCSNLPYFEDEWEGAVKAGPYNFNMCEFKVDNWPDNMLTGFYKLVIDFFDGGDNLIVSATIVIQIEASAGLRKWDFEIYCL